MKKKKSTRQQFCKRGSCESDDKPHSISCSKVQTFHYVYTHGMYRLQSCLRNSSVVLGLVLHLSSKNLWLTWSDLLRAESKGCFVFFFFFSKFERIGDYKLGKVNSCGRTAPKKPPLSFLFWRNLFAVFIMNGTTDTTPATKMIVAKH